VRRRTKNEIALIGAALATALLVRLFFFPVLGNSQRFATFYAAVAVVAAYVGTRAGILTAVFGYLVADWWLIPPRYSFSIFVDPAKHITSAFLYFFVAFVIVAVTHSLRQGRRGW
jgi:K+-sensing histidine kinase KdpD